MSKTLEQIDHLTELKKVIEESVLAVDMYQDEYYEDRYCVIGHMAKQAGVIEELVEHFNYDAITVVSEEIVSKIESYYGLGSRELYRLQEINDGLYGDSWFEDQEIGKRKLLYQIDNYIIGGI